MSIHLNRFALALLAAALFISTAWEHAGIAADKKPAAPREIDIRVAQHKAWDNTPERVRAILASAAQELWVYFPDRSLKPILVEPNGGPIVLFERGSSGEYRVQLDTGANLWSQWVFQFSHEFGHILSNYDSVRHKNKWFEETICETASLFVLQRLADTWSKDPAPANWKKFAPSHRSYAEDRITKARLPKGMTLAQWFAVNEKDLARTGVDRERNTTVATVLLPLFQESPAHWEAIGFLAKAKRGHMESFPEYLKAWQGHCTEKHRPFVAAIARQFAIDLDKVTLPPPKE